MIPRNLREATMKRSWVGLHTSPSCSDVCVAFHAFSHSKLTKFTDPNHPNHPNPTLLAPLHVSGNKQCTAQNKELRSWRNGQFAGNESLCDSHIHSQQSLKNTKVSFTPTSSTMDAKGPNALTATLADIHSSLHQFTLPVKVEAFGWFIVHPGRQKFRWNHLFNICVYLHKSLGGMVNHVSTQPGRSHKAFVQPPFDL